MVAGREIQCVNKCNAFLQTSSHHLGNIRRKILLDCPGCGLRARYNLPDELTIPQADADTIMEVGDYYRTPYPIEQKILVWKPKETNTAHTQISKSVGRARVPPPPPSTPTEATVMGHAPALPSPSTIPTEARVVGRAPAPPPPSTIPTKARVVGPMSALSSTHLPPIPTAGGKVGLVEAAPVPSSQQETRPPLPLLQKEVLMKTSNFRLVRQSSESGVKAPVMELQPLPRGPRLPKAHSEGNLYGAISAKRTRKDSSSHESSSSNRDPKELGGGSTIFGSKRSRCVQSISFACGNSTLRTS